MRRRCNKTISQFDKWKRRFFDFLMDFPFDFLFASNLLVQVMVFSFQQEPTSTSIPLQPEVSTWSAGEAPPTAEALRSWNAMDHAVCNKLPTYQWRTRIAGCFTGEMKGWFQYEGATTSEISAILCLSICFLHGSSQVSCLLKLKWTSKLMVGNVLFLRIVPSVSRFFSSYTLGKLLKFTAKPTKRPWTLGGDRFQKSPAQVENDIANAHEHSSSSAVPF